MLKKYIWWIMGFYMSFAVFVMSFGTQSRIKQQLGSKIGKFANKLKFSTGLFNSRTTPPAIIGESQISFLTAHQASTLGWTGRPSLDMDLSV